MRATKYFNQTIPFFASIPASIVVVLLTILVASPHDASAQAKQDAAQAKKDAAKDSIFESLKFRSIGPFRGGRSAAVTGVADNPMLYYMGATGGGIWKTEDAGATCTNICLLYTSPSPRDATLSRMPSSA